LTPIAPLGVIVPPAEAEAVIVKTSIENQAAIEWTAVTLVKS